MTIRQIAELCDVEERTARDWSKNVNCGKNFPSLQNLDTIELSGHGKETDLPVETAVAIIRAGGREALASLLAENAANKDALVVQNTPGIMAQFTKLAEMLEKTTQTMEKQGKLIEAQSLALEDPQKAAYAELEKFVQYNLEVENKPIHRVFVHELWHAYENTAKNPLNEHNFKFKIALDHPEFELKRTKAGDWYFTHCRSLHIL
jgi:hypothetical protein